MAHEPDNSAPQAAQHPGTTPSGLDEDLAMRAFQQRKRRDQALILPLVGMFLILSPMINVFAGAGSILGVPTILLYLLGVWLGLILVAWRLAGKIGDDLDGR